MSLDHSAVLHTRPMIPSLHTDPVGFSESERYLGGITQRTFLSFWSHPNLFRTRAKELTDLLVIFGDDVIVFSDKSCAFQDGEHGWSRWYRRAVLESAHQLHRAAGWILKHPDRIYTDAKCERPFPLQVPKQLSIHLVAVATGAREAAARHGGGDGSLIFLSNTDGSEAFTIGDLDPKRDFVHVFDDRSLSLLLRELDTATDFVAYLRKRAAFLRRGNTILVQSEAALLENYLIGMNERVEHDFIVPADLDPAKAIAVSGNWEKFVKSGPYRRKQAADADSYVWDRIIEYFTKHADQGTLYTGQENGLAGTEGMLRFFAGENRLARRQLGRAITEVRELACHGPDNIRVRTVISSTVTDRAYVFCVLRRDGFESEERYRRVRQGLFGARAEVTKLRMENVKTVVGMCVAPANDPDESIDLAVRTFADPWPQEEREAAERICDALEVSRTTDGLDANYGHDYEFPAPPFSPPIPMRQPRARDIKAVKKAKRKAERDARKRNRKR